MDVDPSQLTPEQRIVLLDQVATEVVSHVDALRLFVGGEEAKLLWDATVDSFAQGVWVATILCAQATCERTLAALVSLHEFPGHGQPAPKRWERWGLGVLIKHIREQGWVPADVLDDVDVLCEVRKPYGHWRLPFDEGTIGRQVGEALRDGWEGDPEDLREQILAEEAFGAARTAMRLYWGNFGLAPFPG